MKYCVCILQNEKDEGLYIGMTKHLDRRIQEHNQGKVPSTLTRFPFKILHIEEAQDGKCKNSREILESGAGREKAKQRRAQRLPTAGRDLKSVGRLYSCAGSTRPRACFNDFEAYVWIKFSRKVDNLTQVFSIIMRQFRSSLPFSV
jgi:putative endonuclease